MQKALEDMAEEGVLKEISENGLAGCYYYRKELAYSKINSSR